MKKIKKRELLIGNCFLLAFLLFTVAVGIIDVQEIGPLKSAVGFATLNGFVHNLLGVHLSLYNVTDWLGLLPIGCVLGFALLGLWQWIKRKHILKIDHSILALGVFYVVVLALYVLFEMLTINYRPVLINGILEASYPSSTTMLTLCVMPTAMMQLRGRIQRVPIRRLVMILIAAFTAFMVIGRLISGVHWFTDILGGALLSTGLVLVYYSFSDL